MAPSFSLLSNSIEQAIAAGAPPTRGFDRQAGRQAGTQADRDTKRQRHGVRQTHGPRYTETPRQRQKDGHTHTQTHRDTQRHTQRHIDTHTQHKHTHTPTQTHTHTHTPTHPHTHVENLPALPLPPKKTLAEITHTTTSYIDGNCPVSPPQSDPTHSCPVSDRANDRCCTPGR